MKKILNRCAIFFVLILALSAAIPQVAMAEGGALTAVPGTLQSSAAGNGIDTSTSQLGYITLQYSDGTSAAMRAGLCFNGGSWSYYAYEMGKSQKLELTGGSGSYSVALFKKVSGSYVSVASASFTAVVSGTTPTSAAFSDSANTTGASAYPQYLVSASEISFSANDSVSKKAAALCKGLKGDQAKIRAIYNYIARNFKYDYDFANKVLSGQIRSYTPDPANILSNKKGVCYDFASLFAAMCRSQGIPCKLVKGYSTKVSGYHAWNSAYDSKTGQWYTIDLTLAVCKGNRAASRFSSCCMADKYYTPHSST